jgi:cell division protein FtsW
VWEHPLADYYIILAAAGALTVLGVVMVASAASVVSQVHTGDPYYFGKRQIMFTVLGLLAAVVMARLPIRVLRSLAFPALLLGLGLVLLTYSPLAVEVNGNQNWVRLGPSWTQFQPSEFAKLAIIVWGAQHLARKEPVLDDLREWLFYVLTSLLVIGLVLIHDLGSAAVMAFMLVATLFLAGAPLRLLAGLGLAGGAALAALIVFQRNRMNRIIAWLNPDQYTLTDNFQVNHGLYALASGGWWGEGLGASRQKWGGLMETGYTDYIFAIIGEELGLAGTLAVIVLFVCLCGSGLRLARRTEDTFTRLTAVGVTCWFALQAIVNIAVVLRWLPVLGVTLPLVSYGGSSMIATLMAVGLLVACARADGRVRQVKAEPVGVRRRVTSVFARSRP